MRKRIDATPVDQRHPFCVVVGPEERPDRERALRYAYHFFFRRMMPLPFLVPNGKGSMFDVRIESLTELAPGAHPGLDAICDGIMNGAPFVYEAERFE